jgi:hypothetical protein
MIGRSVLLLASGIPVRIPFRLVEEAKNRHLVCGSSPPFAFALPSQVTFIDFRFVKVHPFTGLFFGEEFTEPMEVKGGCFDVPPARSAAQRAVVPAAKCSINRSGLLRLKRLFRITIPIT